MLTRAHAHTKVGEPHIHTRPACHTHTVRLMSHLTAAFPYRNTFVLAPPSVLQPLAAF